MRAKVSRSSGSSEAWRRKKEKKCRKGLMKIKHQTGYLSHVMKATSVRYSSKIRYCILSENQELDLWYVGNDLIGHTTRIKRVL